jgi:drug/metabolite transporter (DMT)-like permease
MVPASQIIDEFRRRRTRQFVAAVPGIAGIILALMAVTHGSLFGIDGDLLALAGGSAFVAYAIFSIVNWRCPACSRYLGKGMNPSFCPRCGTRLRAG